MNESLSTPSIDELNSEEVQRVLPTIIYLGFLIIAGTIGNVIVIIVYKTKYGPSNTKYFVLCLGAIDLFTCCVVLPLEIATITMQLNFQHVWLCKVSRFVNSVSTMSSAAMLLAISVDRYRKMCKPFGWQIAKKYVLKLCGACISLGLLLSLPSLFIYGRKTVEIPQYNITSSECSVDDSTADTILPLISSIVLLAFFIIGACAILVMYCCIGSALYRHAKRMPEDFRATTKRSLKQRPSVSVLSEADIYIEMNPNGAQRNIKSRSDVHRNGNNNIDKSLHEFDEITVDDTDTMTCENTKAESDKTRSNLSHDENKVSRPAANGDIKSEHHNDSEFQVSELASSVSSLRSNSQTSSSLGLSYRSRSHSVLKYSKQSTNIRKTSILMLIISVTFIVSYLPHLLLMVIREVNDKFVEQLSDAGRAAYKFLLRSYFLNCATNPVIYCIYGSHFRAVCKDLLVSSFRRSKRVGGTV